MQTTPSLLAYEFVQVESLLCAIERHMADYARTLTEEQAIEICMNDPVLKNEKDAKKLARWLIGAEAHRKWRERLNQAVTAQELSLLDFGSKLPVAAPVPVTGVSSESEPQRRLASLVRLGGTSKWRQSRWQFTGISKLVAAEKSDARPRSDEKTIRRDLVEAATAERDAKQAGVLFSALKGNSGTASP